MNEITVDQSLDYFLTTLHWLDESNINLSDEELLAIIHEELTIDSHTFLHNWTVQRLVENNRIPKEVSKMTEELRNVLTDLIEQKPDIEQIRFDKDWINARNAARSILKKIDEFNKQK